MSHVTHLPALPDFWHGTLMTEAVTLCSPAPALANCAALVALEWLGAKAVGVCFDRRSKIGGPLYDDESVLQISSEHELLEAISMAEPLEEPLEFVFLWWPNNDHGVILSRAYYTLVDRFHFARRTARTWGELLNGLGDGADYLEDFMQFDQTEPQDGDRLEDLQGNVWVLQDAEFPLTQCAQESFQFYGHHFPQCDGAVTIRTEYGMPFLLYPKSAYLSLKTHLTEAGHRVSEEMAVFPMNIYPY